MDHEWEPPCGLKPRISLAFEDVGDVGEMAELLNVTDAVMNKMLFDPSFTPTPEDLASGWANLYLVANISDHAKHFGFTPTRSITAWESALWDAVSIAAIPIGPSAVEFRWVF